MTMPPQSVMLSVAVAVMVAALSDVCDARSSQKEEYPRNISHCDSGPPGMDGFDWTAYSGRWYERMISRPLGPALQDLSGYTVEIDASSFDPNTKDSKFNRPSVDRKETLVFGDSRPCLEWSWACVREQGSSQTTCDLKVDGRKVSQRSAVLVTDYTSTAVVYRETYVNGQFYSKQLKVMVRSPQAQPDPNLVVAPLYDYCGLYAATLSDEFFHTVSSSDYKPGCLDIDFKRS